MVVLHGLEGTERSHYIGGLLNEIRQRGWGADVLLFRSCGSELNELPRFYHSGETEDLSHVLGLLLEEFPYSGFALAGFSLGGNVLLKWLGERGDDLPRRIRAAAAVSVPFDLGRSADRIGMGFSRNYEAHFLRSLKRKARAKHQRFPYHPAFGRIDSARTLRGFDDVVTAPLHGFRDADDYYTRSSAMRWLPGVRLPTLLLSATDDPFLPASVLTDVARIADTNTALNLEFTPKGGHVGFVSGALPWRPFYYAEWRVAEFCASRLSGAGSSVSADSAETGLSLITNQGDRYE
jgi:predicted alpha/beta-fold hydrolase